VTALIDIILNKTPSTTADVDLDGNISIADVTALVDMILAGNY